MKRYETLVILQNATQEEGLKEAIDQISKEITDHGGKVETVQKMDRKPFARITDKKATAGFYVNFIYELETSKAKELNHRLSGLEGIYRTLVTQAARAAAVPA